MPSDTSLIAAPRPFDPAGERPSCCVTGDLSCRRKGNLCASEHPTESVLVRVHETKMSISGQTAPRKLTFAAQVYLQSLQGASRDWLSPDVAGKLRKKLARLLLESFHRLHVRNRPVAHAGATQFREFVVRRDALHNHDVDRQRRFLSNPTDMGGLGQPGNEEAGRAGRRVCFRPLQGLLYIAAVT